MFTVWLLIFILTGLTLYAAFVGYIAQPLWELFLVIEGSVIAELILAYLADRLRHPTILITPIAKMLDIGFNIQIKEKNIQKASVYCDDTKINWKEQDGKEKESKDLRVGETSSFYPFRIILSEERLQQDKQVIRVSVVQKIVEYGENYTKSFERPFYSSFFDIPRGSFSTRPKMPIPYGFPKFHCYVRLTGEGIEEEVNRLLDFSCTFCFDRYVKSDRIEDVYVQCDFSQTKTFIC
jgi:hypothetical protein